MSNLGNKVDNREFAEKLSNYETLTLICIYRIVRNKDNGEGALCQEVIAKLKQECGKDYKDTTVYTYLKHLVDKGFLKQEKRGLTKYFPTMEESKVRQAYLEYFVKNWYKGDLDLLKKEIDAL